MNRGMAVSYGCEEGCKHLCDHFTGLRCIIPWPQRGQAADPMNEPCSGQTSKIFFSVFQKLLI